jgi:cytochrome c peroxidase
MPLSHHQSRRRRGVLLVLGLASFGLLAVFVAVPLWDAGAGGLERRERARIAKIERAAGRTPVRAPRTAQRQSWSRDETRRDPRYIGPPAPAQTGVPVAIPVPIDPPVPGRIAQPYPPLPRAAPPRPQAVPLPPQELRPSESTVDASGVPLQTLKALFKRPQPLRPPRGAEAEQIALGARLFAERKLSADHKMSCATCHDPAQSFADARRKARGNKSQELERNTPALWNLDGARAYYWDGRAPTLEAQIKDAIEREGEMDATVEAGILWLSRDPFYVAAFQRAFGGQNALNGENLLKALASYERSLVSPETRFDRWIEGDFYALSEKEIAGMRLFTGKGRCLACHGGWRFTDDGFHDIGVRSKDPGRQAIAGGAERAFKTPSLREAVWTAPYMHDGSLKTLDDVVAHYAGKLDMRPSLAPELKRGITLTEAERGDLVAFLKSLSSDSQPKSPSLPAP